MIQPKVKLFLRDFLLIEGLLSGWFLWDNIHRRGRLFFAVFALFFLCGLAWLFINKLKERKEVKYLNKRFSVPAILLTLIACVALVAAFYLIPIQLFGSGSGRLLVVVLFAGIGALILYMVNPTIQPRLPFLVILLTLGLLTRIAFYIPDLQSTPFALGWSEGSRYYYASTYLSKSIYGQKLPLSILHPSRYLMQALPFMFGSTDIFVHRLWQVLLWLGMTALAARLLAKRLRSNQNFPVLWIAVYLFLFLFQGAVYYHLLVCVVLVLAGFNPKKPIQTLIFVLLASAWAGISRVNWLPVPGMLAAALYFLERAMNGQKWVKYFSWPVIWTVLGTALGYAVKQAYVAISGEPKAFFDSAFTSDLLWKRLLPNATFNLGILGALLLVCLPFGILLARRFKGNAWRELAPWRWIALSGMGLALFLVGLIVSVKIGGGGDLHNMDSFLVYIALVVPSLLLGVYDPETATSLPLSKIRFEPLWLTLAVFVPVFFSFMQVRAWNLGPVNSHAQDLREINQALEVLKDQPGEVLFITERQLQTFSAVPAMKVMPEYEKVFLQEMAMGNNKAYLNMFYKDLADHKFKAIFMEPLNTEKQDSKHSFAEENNVYVERVILPLLEQYELAIDWRDGAINLLVPKIANNGLEALQAIQN